MTVDVCTCTNRNRVRYTKILWYHLLIIILFQEFGYLRLSSAKFIIMTQITQVSVLLKESAA
jgi:hypothetical protein